MELVEGKEYRLTRFFANCYGSFDAGTPIIYKGEKLSKKPEGILCYCFEAKVSGKPVSFINYEGKVEEIMWDDNWKEKKTVLNGLTMKRGQYIIGSVDKKTGAVSVSSNPAIHKTYSVAEGEAKRLAAIEPSKKFVIFEAKALATAVEVVVE